MSHSYKGLKHHFGDIQNLTMQGIRYSRFHKKLLFKNKHDVVVVY
jgi:hypothetical protein